MRSIPKSQFGTFEQDYGYVNVREGAHMFYWLFYTTAEVENYTERPLIVWLQGGPGGSSTGIGNFEILGPLDLSLQERNTSWVKNFNVLFVDNPVGTGYSYVDDLSFLTTTNDEIALDFVELMRGFYDKNPEFKGVPLYIYGQSYGGKMAVDMGIRIAMGNAWISPVDATLTWGPLLLAAGLVDQAGHDNIQANAREAERLFNAGLYRESSFQWEFSRNIMIRDGSRPARNGEWDLDTLMNSVVKEALGIPEHVVWVEKLLNETDIIVTKYNGNLDLICDTPGQILWVDRLKWPGAEAYRNTPRLPIWEDGKLEGYYKAYGNFRFFWINVAGHSVPRDNPAGTNAFLLSILVAAGVAVLIWWLVRDPVNFTVIGLEENGFGDVTYSAALTRIDGAGDVFWWFYPTTVAAATSKPLLLWLDGVTGLPPSMLANFGMFGPIDFNMNKREDSWVDEYNLLFIDAPIGTGFSTPLNSDAIPKTLDENANGIVSPALALTKLGFYLEELGYIDASGRAAVEGLSTETTSLVQEEQYGEALDKFLSLGEFVNQEAGGVAVNLGFIITLGKCHI
ncbi:Retinoid-inducible serine carboxypeptidase [Operophtera brumata]|uniref:Retinoid-inducible serine carboxypeptidase n=1 Tax=Operophtera brumata TaxID=104452 RepID=A0A0L7LFF7_OPEBR|nr:Retinoid-inducible serine carboxypeptidase [Operophtera brumata]